MFDAADPSPVTTFDHVTGFPDPARASQRRQLVDELGGAHDGEPTLSPSDLSPTESRPAKSAPQPVL